MPHFQFAVFIVKRGLNELITTPTTSCWKIEEFPNVMQHIMFFQFDHYKAVWQGDKRAGLTENPALLLSNWNQMVDGGIFLFDTHVHYFLLVASLSK